MTYQAAATVRVFSFIECCELCGHDIHWQGRISHRPPCQNCQRVKTEDQECLAANALAPNALREVPAGASGTGGAP